MESLTCLSLQILGKTQTGGILDFQIYDQSIKSENSKTSNDIDMKVRLVTKFDKRDTSTSNVLPLVSCDVIVIFMIDI